MFYAGFSREQEEARRWWVARILEIASSDPRTKIKMKEFKPKFPNIPKLADYKILAPEQFWREFPVNLTCPGKPSIKVKTLKQWVRALGR